MINKISEGTLRSAMKIDPNGTMQKHMAQKKAEEVRKHRPVENSDAGAKSESRDPQSDWSKYVFEDKTMVFEKYNRTGDLVYRLPPSSKPVDERV